MCEVCDFYDKVKVARKSNPATEASGQRSIWGYYDHGDAPILARFYPKVGREMIEKIAALIRHPRLLEVAGLVELTERYLEGSFSKIRGVVLNVASNPLSILFWSPRNHTVERIKTRESEMLHGPMEKMALRRESLDSINRLLGTTFGMQITYACSCCGTAVGVNDLSTLYASDYYRRREGFGRLFDSDVLTTSNTLYEGVSVADVPQKILDASADFGQAEVNSYMRFAQAAETALHENPVRPDLEEALSEVREFLTGAPTH